MSPDAHCWRAWAGGCVLWSPLEVLKSIIMDRERELWVKATEDRSLWFGGRRPPDLETPVARSPLYHVEASVLRGTICSSLEPVPGIFTGVYTVSTRADLCGLDISTPDPAMQQRVEIKVGEPLLSAHWVCRRQPCMPPWARPHHGPALKTSESLSDRPVTV